MGTRQNSRETVNSRNRRLLHHWKLLCIPYLLAKFETCTAFLRLKRGLISFIASVALAIDIMCVCVCASVSVCMCACECKCKCVCVCVCVWE